MKYYLNIKHKRPGLESKDYLLGSPVQSKRTNSKNKDSFKLTKTAYFMKIIKLTIKPMQTMLSQYIEPCDY